MPRKPKNLEVVLDRAEEEFAACGYDGARLRRIADALGMQPAALYYYFSSKLDLYRAVMERHHAMRAEVFGKIREDEDPLEELRRQISAFIAFFAERPSAAGLFHQALVSGPDAAEYGMVKEREDAARRFTRPLRRGLRSGRFSHPDPAAFAMHSLILIITPFAARSSFTTFFDERVDYSPEVVERIRRATLRALERSLDFPDPQKPA